MCSSAYPSPGPAPGLELPFLSLQVSVLSSPAFARVVVTLCTHNRMVAPLYTIAYGFICSAHPHPVITPRRGLATWMSARAATQRAGASAEPRTAAWRRPWRRHRQAVLRALVAHAFFARHCRHFLHRRGLTVLSPRVPNQRLLLSSPRPLAPRWCCSRPGRRQCHAARRMRARHE